MIRNLHFSDFLKLGKMHQAEVGLNLPDGLLIPSSSLSAVFLHNLPVNNLSSSVYIYEENKRAVAFLQARARQRREEWEILALGTIGDIFLPEVEEAEETNPVEEIPADQPQPEIVAEAEQPAEDEVESTQSGDNQSTLEIAWLKLLEHMVVDAGEKGAERIFARLSTESAEISLFNQTGFHAFTRENIFVYNHDKLLERPVGLPLKQQRGRDLWPVQRLYEAVTPNLVQHAEQLNSESWEIVRGYLPRPTKETAWVYIEPQADRASAYVRLISYRHKHLVRVLCLDGQRKLLPDLIRFALANIKPGGDCQVFCSVREYQSEQEAILEEVGFKYFGRQALLVKHTAHLLKVSEKATAQIRDRRLELPQTTVSAPTRYMRVIRRYPATRRKFRPRLPSAR